MIEVKAFETNLVTWLKATATTVSNRVYRGWPQQPPTYPFIAYHMSRVPYGDYPGHAWECQVQVDLFDPSGDTLDTIEDEIYQVLQTGGVPASLTGSGVTCRDFTLTAIGEDTEVYSPEDNRYVALVRRLTFRAGIVHAAE